MGKHMPNLSDSKGKNVKKKDHTTYEAEVSEVEKIKKRDKIRRIIIFGIFGLSVCVALLLLLISSIAEKFAKIEYPESTLSKDLQKEVHTQTYEDLTKVISFGEFYLCIPDKEVVSSSDSTLILKDSTHTYYFAKGAFCEHPALYDDLPFIINSVGANSYTPHLTDEGFLNTLYAVYITGSAKAGGNIYFVSYELFSETEKLEILITAKNQGNLNEAKSILDRMVNTLILKETPVQEELESLPESDTEESLKPEASDAPKTLSTNGVRSRYSYDKYDSFLPQRKSISPEDSAYDTVEETYFYHVQNVTESIDYDRVYFEVTLSFADEETSYFGSDAGDCYLIDLNGYEIRPKVIDDTYAHALTYVFECPNEYENQVNDYTLIIPDPLRKVSLLYYVVNEPKYSKYSPLYEAPDGTDGVQEESTYDETKDTVED